MSEPDKFHGPFKPRPFKHPVLEDWSELRAYPVRLEIAWHELDPTLWREEPYRHNHESDPPHCKPWELEKQYVEMQRRAQLLQEQLCRLAFLAAVRERMESAA